MFGTWNSWCPIRARLSIRRASRRSRTRAARRKFTRGPPASPSAGWSRSRRNPAPHPRCRCARWPRGRGASRSRPARTRCAQLSPWLLKSPGEGKGGAMANYAADVLVIGGGIAGIAAALELLDHGRDVLILDRDEENGFGGLAKESFGGLFFVNSREQQRNGIRDTPTLALRDWNSFAEFAP